MADKRTKAQLLKALSESTAREAMWSESYDNLRKQKDGLEAQLRAETRRRRALADAVEMTSKAAAAAASASCELGAAIARES